MLKNTQEDMKINVVNDVLMVHKKKGKKTRNKSKGKGKVLPKPKIKKDKDGVCFHCNKGGHWKRNCKLDQDEIKKGSVTTASGIFVIETNSLTPKSWVLDTGCGTHICNDVQGLQRSRRLAKGEVDLRVGNGARVAALAVGTYLLTLPSGLVLVLNNCYFVPAMSINIIFISSLALDGYKFVIENNNCFILKDNLFYGNVLLERGLYVLDLNKREL